VSVERRGKENVQNCVHIIPFVLLLKGKEKMHDDSLSLCSVPSALDMSLHLILQQSYEVLTTIPFLIS